MAVKIEMLRCFCAVAEKGSLQAAAEHLGRTPSALSMMLKQLEDNVGGKLFEKDRKNRLTDTGRYVLQQAQNELSHFDATVQAIETYARNPRGVLRIASVPSAVARHVIPAVEKFSQAFPHVKVDVRDMDSASVVRTLSSGFVELGVASWSGTIDGIENRPLLQDDFGLVCHPDHPLALKQSPVSIADLSSEAFVSNDLCSRINNPVLQNFISDTRLSVHNILSLMTILKSANYYTILPSSVIGIYPDELKFKRIKELDTKRTVSMLYRPETANSSYFVKFLDTLEKSAIGLC